MKIISIILAICAWLLVGLVYHANSDVVANNQLQIKSKVILSYRAETGHVYRIYFKANMYESWQTDSRWETDARTNARPIDVKIDCAEIMADQNFYWLRVDDAPFPTIELGTTSTNGPPTPPGI